VRLTAEQAVDDADAVGDEAEQAYAKEDYDVAAKAYAERLDEIRDDLPKSVRKLLNDDDWSLSNELHFVDDHFYIVPAEELSWLLETDEHTFIIRYTLVESPVVDPPVEAEQPYFQVESLKVIEEEWDIEDGYLVHRILLNNGFVIKLKPKDFRWWKVKVEDEA